MGKGRKMLDKVLNSKKGKSKMGPKAAPKSGNDPHGPNGMQAKQAMYQKKQMDMLKKPKNMGDNFKGAYGGK